MPDIDKIKWREVGQIEYEQSDFRQARRTTIVDYQPVKWELGTFPAELPTKPGAVVAPVAPNTQEFVPYVLSPEKTWFIFDTAYGGHPYAADEDEIREMLDEGSFYIAYGGYDE